MILPTGLSTSRETNPVRKPSRERAYATLYSPPPTYTSSELANSILPCPAGESRTMHSPNETSSNLQLPASRNFIRCSQKNLRKSAFLCAICGHSVCIYSTNAAHPRHTLHPPVPGRDDQAGHSSRHGLRALPLLFRHRPLARRD